MCVQCGNEQLNPQVLEYRGSCAAIGPIVINGSLGMGNPPDLTSRVADETQAEVRTR